MEEAETKMEICNDVEPKSENIAYPDIIHPAVTIKLKPDKNFNKMPRKRAPYKNRKQKWFIEHSSYSKSKNGGIEKLPKIKKRKYTKSKTECSISARKKLLKHSIQKFIPVQVSNAVSGLSPIVNLLQKHNFQYEVMPESLRHENVFLQDKYMNTFFDCYPEHLCIDFLCEIPELELNLCLFICIDGNGYCEIVAIGLLRTYDSGLPWLFEVFKKHNPNWKKIKIITCDIKDNSIQLTKEAFPDNLVLVSFFHSLKALKRDISNLNYALTEQEMNDFILLYEKMVYACDESSYNNHFKEIQPDQLASFFKEKWLEDKEAWALGLQLNSKLFLKSYHGFLLKIRKEIRPAINMQDSIESVIQKLCVISESFRKEKFQMFTSVFSVATLNTKQMPLQAYSKFLTRYAAELMLEQFSYSNSVKNIRKLTCGKYMCASEDLVSIHACSCNFFQYFILPCCHIFAIRMQFSFPLFAETLCSPRWTSVYYQNTFLLLQKSSLSENVLCIDERFEKYFKACSEIWPLLTECSEIFLSQERLQIFHNLIDAWHKNLLISIKEASEVTNSSLTSNTASVGIGSLDNWKEMHGVSLKEILDSDYDFCSVLQTTLIK